MNKNEEAARLARINEFAKKAKTVGLTEEEKAERDILRKEFLVAFRDNMVKTLDNVSLVDPDGTETPLARKNN